MTIGSEEKVAYEVVLHALILMVFLEESMKVFENSQTILYFSNRAAASGSVRTSVRTFLFYF